MGDAGDLFLHAFDTRHSLRERRAKSDFIPM